MKLVWNFLDHNGKKPEVPGFKKSGYLLTVDESFHYSYTMGRQCSLLARDGFP